jgi:hypothetical protein
VEITTVKGPDTLVAPLLVSVITELKVCVARSYSRPEREPEMAEPGEDALVEL